MAKKIISRCPVRSAALGDLRSLRLAVASRVFNRVTMRIRSGSVHLLPGTPLAVDEVKAKRITHRIADTGVSMFAYTLVFSVHPGSIIDVPYPESTNLNFSRLQDLA